MARRAVPPSLWSGSDRVRIGERLQASLAGILELGLLRETQKGTVESALGIGDPAGAVPGGQRQGWGSLGAKEPLPPAKLDRSKSEDLLGIPEKPCVSYCSSEGIDVGRQAGNRDSRTTATSLALRTTGSSEQLLLPKRPRAQTELSFTAPETSEADSRPSSGFYETSEMGSLSNSSTSMHSECPGGSHCSVGSLSHLPGLRDSGCSRPRSTDEATVRLLDLRLQRVMGPNAPSSPHAAARRPVSTGDLEFLLSLGELSPAFPQLLQYKCDLVSRSTSEIYHYPSPLHAVALQSPLFTSGLSRGPSQEDLSERAAIPTVQEGSPQSGTAPSEEQRQVQLDRYIAKLVLRYRCRSAASRTEPGYLAGHQKSQSMSSVCGSPLGAGPLPGWKIRRRISTCSHLRSPEGPDSSQALDSPGGRGSTASSVGSSERSMGLLLEQLSLCQEQPEGAGWAEALSCHPHVVRVKASSRKALGTERERLYKGKHASRELVKAGEGAERSWLSPRELLRRISLRRRPALRAEGGSRCSSEVNVRTPRPVYRCSSQHCLEPPGRHKWASVLEISSQALGRPKAEPFPPPSRQLAFSTDSCFPDGSQLELQPQRAEGSSASSLSEVDAVSLNGDWRLRQLGPPRARPLHASATLDSNNLAMASFKLHRTRSFKELKRMVSRSLRPLAPKASGASK
ncbi:dapper homolog 2-like isoform X2 [Trachemys scripta elegans]|uniref:dapper homolog 2-like isoform X2 n=1 Tax=Trachemys scripta elegans TaxID=31138 RepID=UPI001551B6EA|nr:dapper homolog 2-like isoform X2 [Trachemys scripta elegans]